MAFEYLGANALNYNYCRYGDSKRVFRGPKVATDGIYDVVIGGTETFGKFVEMPYPDLMSTKSGVPAVNLGQMYSGADYFGDDRDLLALSAKARRVVIQLTGVQNMTNRFYLVHPRRNDRFLRPTKLLSAIFSDVDFTDIHFTGHLMGALQTQSPGRFEAVLAGMRDDWIERMRSLILAISSPVTLLWMSDRAPDQCEFPEINDRTPLFITNDMLGELASKSVALVKVVAMPEEIQAGFPRMIFNPIEEPAAEQMLGPIVHQEVARQLNRVILKS